MGARVVLDLAVLDIGLRVLARVTAEARATAAKKEEMKAADLIIRNNLIGALALSSFRINRSS